MQLQNWHEFLDLHCESEKDIALLSISSQTD